MIKQLKKDIAFLKEKFEEIIKIKDNSEESFFNFEWNKVEVIFEILVLTDSQTGKAQKIGADNNLNEDQFRKIIALKGWVIEKKK